MVIYSLCIFIPNFKKSKIFTMQIPLFDNQINFMGNSSRGLNNFTTVAQWQHLEFSHIFLWGSQHWQFRNRGIYIEWFLFKAYYFTSLDSSTYVSDSPRFLRSLWIINNIPIVLLKRNFVLFLGTDFSKMRRLFHNIEINYVSILGNLFEVNYSVCFSQGIELNSNKRGCVCL